MHDYDDDDDDDDDDEDCGGGRGGLASKRATACGGSSLPWRAFLKFGCRLCFFVSRGDNIVALWGFFSLASMSACHNLG